MSYTNVFGGSTIYPSAQTYLALAMSTDITLSWPIEQQTSGNVVADIIDVNASGAGLNLDIPDARQVSTGYTALFNNVGANTVTIRNAAGGTILSLASGTVWQIYLSDNSTLAGTWRVFQYGASVSVVNAAALAGSGLKAISSTLNQSMPVTTINANYTVVDSDRAKAINWTGGVGTLTLPSAAGVGSDWFFSVRNAGSGNVVLSPPSGTIDGAATKSVAVSSGGIVYTDGVNYFTVGFGSSSGSSSFDYVSIDVSGSGDYTLSGVNLNRIAYKLTGILTGTRNFVVPGSVQQYWINNATTGAFSLFVKTVAQTPGIEVIQGTQSIVYCDGTNVVNAESSTVSFPISIAQGGTGAITAATARTNLGSTTLGDALFTTASQSAARASLGSTAVGDAVFVAANQAAALAAIGALSAVAPATLSLAGDGTILTLARTGGNATTLVASVVDATGIKLNVGGTAARSLELATFGTTRLTLGAAGNATLAAPSSGVTLTVTAIATGTPTSLVSGITGGTNNPRWQFTHDESTGLSVLDFTGSTSPIGRISRAGTAILDFSANRNITISAPGSGVALTVNGVAGSRPLTAVGNGILNTSANGTDTPEIRLQRTAGTTSDWEIYIPVGSSDLRLFNAADRYAFGATGNMTIFTPASGVPLVINGIANSITQRWTDGTVILETQTGGGNAAYIGTTGAHSFNIFTNGLTRASALSTGNWQFNQPSSGATITVSAIAGVSGVVITTAGQSQLLTRNTTNSVDAIWGADSTSAFAGSFTNHPFNLYANSAARLQLAAGGGITVQQPSTTTNVALTVNGATTAAIGILNGGAAGQSYLRFQVTGSTIGDIGNANAVISGGSTSDFGITAAAGGALVLGTNGSTQVLKIASTFDSVFTGSAATTPSAVAFSAAAGTINCRLSNVFTTTLTANVTSAYAVNNPSDGQTINWFLTQDATGNRTMTWPSSFKWPGGTAGVLTTTGNAVDLLTATFRSATGFWYATLIKDLK